MRMELHGGHGQRRGIASGVAALQMSAAGAPPRRRALAFASAASEAANVLACNISAVAATCPWRTLALSLGLSQGSALRRGLGVGGGQRLRPLNVGRGRRLRLKEVGASLGLSQGSALRRGLGIGGGQSVSA